MKTKTLGAALCLCTALPALAAVTGSPGGLAATERIYADWLDASYAVTTLEAGPATELDGLALPGWRQRRDATAQRLAQALPHLSAARLGVDDRRALELMRNGVADAPSTPAAAGPGVSAQRCATAPDAALDRHGLSAALYACFESLGNHIEFEGHTIVRTTALELLAEIDSQSRRRALFAAFGPLWSAIGGDGSARGPYRRLIALTAADPAGSKPIADAAATIGKDAATIEGWLVAVLDAWRAATPAAPVEPWDYWQSHMAATRALDPHAPADRIEALSARFYRDLGADLAALGVEHDLEVRPGKAPLAYADFVRIGRIVDGRWRPARARVSANVERGGLFVLNEIVHEDGHAVHMAAVRTRPAFYGLGDDLLVEAFADVSSWSTADPLWQRRYLGAEADASGSLRALFANVMLDVAWGLFELRMLRAPDTDPNALWTGITSHYLHIVPHPELAWWALRVQLVDVPGYMINYGLGAVVTADLRRRTRAAIGPFAAGNRRWYPWLSENLLRYGASLATRDLLQRFLGRPVSTDALIAELRRIRAPGIANPPAPAR